MASTRLTRTPSSATNRRTWTVSLWVKRSSIGNYQYMFAQGTANTWINFNSNHRLEFNVQDNVQDYDVQSTQLFRDVNGWYHIVCAVDTTQSTASNRVKLYVNGEQITDLSATNYPPQNYETGVNNTGTFVIGRLNYADVSYFDGSISHFHLCDGTQYQASDFGETDANGVWTIKTSPSVTYGTNGFFILKDGNSVTDQSGNGNNFTVASGTLTNTEDNPSNVFATVNILSPYATNYDFYNGNTTVENDGSAASWTTRWGISTLGMSSGKFYAEAKIANIGTNQMYALGLVKDAYSQAPSSSIGGDGIAYYSTGGIYKFATQTQTVSSYTTGDIIGLAFDATNGTAQWYKNGSAVGTAETGLSTDGTWFFVTNQYSNGMVNLNYGNGYFGTTAVASAGTNASGIGIFEYDVPTGYTALSTKGLNL